MKKVFLFAAVMLSACIAKAQTSFQLGYVSSSEKQDLIIGDHNNNYSGFMVGIDDNINLVGDLNVAPGLAMEFSFDEDDDVKYKEFNLMVPVDFNYGFQLGDALKLYLFAGPTIDFGLMAKDDDNSRYDSDKKIMNRFDILLGGGAWVDINDVIRVKAGYKAGMLDLAGDDVIGVDSWKRNRFTVSVGYIF